MKSQRKGFTKVRKHGSPHSRYIDFQKGQTDNKLMCTIGKRFLKYYFIQDPILLRVASVQFHEIRDFWSRVSEREVQEIMTIEVWRCFGKVGGGWPIAPWIRKIVPITLMVSKPAKTLNHAPPHPDRDW